MSSSAGMARNPHYPCMTHLMTRGTFYDVGYNVGLHFSERIKRYFHESDFHQELLPFYDSRAGRDYYEECLRVCQDCFPQYVREVRGTADGAGLSFEHVFMANVFERTLAGSILQGQDDKDSPSQTTAGPADQKSAHGAKSVDEFGCTTLFVNSQDVQLILHNEDSDPLIKACGYLLSAEIEEEGRRERFTSFCYPGTLPGRAFSFNGHGVVFTSNVLYPAEIARAATSRIFLLRALLSARDVEDVVRLVQNAPHGSAFGFSVNLSTKTGCMTSLEVGPGKPQSRLHVHEVTQQSDPDAPCHYYHFNSYKHLKVLESGSLVSSTRRAERTRELPPPRSLQQALEVMGDTHDPLSPIFRTPRPTDLGETVCTAVFDVTARQVLLYQGREDLVSNTPFVKLPMC